MSECYVLKTCDANCDPKYVTFVQSPPTITARIMDATRFDRHEDAEDVRYYLESLPVEYRPTCLNLAVLRYEP